MADPLSEFRLDGEVAVVTGGMSGLGKAVADALAAVGARVAVFDLAATGDAYKVDVSDEAQVKAAFDQVMARHGRVDVLFNNAGIAVRQPATELTLDNWNKVVAVNMTGVLLCAREAARHMIAGTRGGRIVNTASIMGFSGGGLYPNTSYQATKGAVVNMTRSFAVEWAKHGIRVNAIAPTWVRTPLIKNITDNPELVARIEAMTPMGRLAEPQEIIGGVLYLATRASAMVTGHTLAIDGGYLAQ